MLDFKILNQYGTTRERLREIAEAKRPKETERLAKKTRQKRETDAAIRERWEKEIRSRLYESIEFSLNNHQFYSSADLAWDSSPINKMTVPLELYAQGKITFTTCRRQLKESQVEEEYLKKDENGEVIGIELPKFREININLVRSFLSRRLAAQSNKYKNLFPYYKYVARGTSAVSKLRADALSQRVEIMADQYGYRHHDVQVMRDMLLYGHSIDFLRSSWEVEKQWRRKNLPRELESQQDEQNIQVESYVEREGVSWVNPHPTRVFWDWNHPLASINEDNGVEYIGFWDIKRYRDIRHNPDFFNREDIKFTSSLADLHFRHRAYFDQHYCKVKVPEGDENFQFDQAAQNDRSNWVGVYNSEKEDNSILLAEYFKKMVPSEEGVGTYPFPVWVRFTVASDSTIVFAEIMPTTPAAYCGLNENDKRLLNLSFAHEVMPFQDQMSNLTSQLLYTIQADLLKVVGINTDMIQNETERDKVKNQLKGRNFFSKPVVMEYSLNKASDLNMKIDPFTIKETSPNAGASTEIFQAMSHLIAMVERLQAFSPAELGQAAPREITATESAAISQTTQTMFSFISDAIDDFRAAKKKIIFDAMMSKSQAQIRVPVAGRYTEDTVKQAGFDVDSRDSESAQTGEEERQFTVIGDVGALNHDYQFSSRDGAERPSDPNAANTLVQLLGMVFKVPGIAEHLGKERLFAIMNEIFRKSGAGFDLVLEVDSDESDALGQSQMDQLQQIVQRMAEQLKTNTENLQEVQNDLSQVSERTDKMQALAKTVRKNAEDIKKVLENKDDVMETMKYESIPPDVQRQVEAAAGYEPSQMSPEEIRNAKNGDKDK